MADGVVPTGEEESLNLPAARLDALVRLRDLYPASGGRRIRGAPAHQEGLVEGVRGGDGGDRPLSRRKIDLTRDNGQAERGIAEGLGGRHGGADEQQAAERRERGPLDDVERILHENLLLETRSGSGRSRSKMGEQRAEYRA